MSLNRDAIQAKKPQPVEREVKTLGGSVFVKPISSMQRLELIGAAANLETPKEYGTVMFGVVASTVVDSEGNPLFASAEDVGEYPTEVTDELVSIVKDLNNIGQDAIAEEEKN